MSSESTEPNSAATRKLSPQDVLPQVEPPSAGFLVQLFLMLDSRYRKATTINLAPYLYSKKHTLVYFHIKTVNFQP